MVVGWKGLPVYDLSRAYYTLGVGADFLGGWASLVWRAGPMMRSAPNDATLNRPALAGISFRDAQP